MRGTGQSWNQVHVQYQTVYRRIRLIIEPMGFQGPFRRPSSEDKPRRRQRRNEKEQREQRRGETSILQGRVRRPARSTLLPSLLIQLSTTLASLPIIPTLEFSNDRDALCDDAAFVDCFKKRKKKKMERVARKREKQRAINFPRSSSGPYIFFIHRKTDIHRRMAQRLAQ